MELDKLIARVNFFYNKRKTEGLTDAEQEEQTELRRQYIDIMKGNIKSQLEQIEFVDNKEEQSCEMDCDCKKH